MEQELHQREREPREPEAPPQPKPVAAPAVRDITKKVFDGLGLPFSSDTNNLVPIAMPTAGTFKVIESRFAFGSSGFQCETAAYFSSIARSRREMSRAMFKITIAYWSG